MSSDTIYKTFTDSPVASLDFANKLGALLSGGELIELVGDVGAGKTLLARGIAQGLGFLGEVASPTFTISRIYHLPQDRKLYHFDFYRLQAGDLISHELAEASKDPASITIVEWAETLGAVLPTRRLRLTIEAGDKPNDRHIAVEALDLELAYVIKGLA
jgi:tRNA threonylcarbamoyladenosine biosynthesis protein TsaE